MYECRFVVILDHCLVCVIDVRCIYTRMIVFNTFDSLSAQVVFISVWRSFLKLQVVLVDKIYDPAHNGTLYNVLCLSWYCLRWIYTAYGYILTIGTGTSLVHPTYFYTIILRWLYFLDNVVVSLSSATGGATT